ncbi:MAG: hypothetical protein EOP35_19100 [Rubrivivax sp.]|nr:MAG: hypothetical protein EOP35_19100 [Rubrivivax sp.]
MQLTLVGMVLAGCGMLYLRRPALYRRGVWMKTSIAIRLLSEEAYRRYIKGLGVAFIVAGVGCVAWDAGLDKLVAGG